METPIKRTRGRPKTPPIDMPTILKIDRRWEYTTLSAERSLTAVQYDAYGRDGWELVSVYVRMDAVYAVFKREVI